MEDSLHPGGGSLALRGGLAQRVTWHCFPNFCGAKDAFYILLCNKHLLRPVFVHPTCLLQGATSLKADFLAKLSFFLPSWFQSVSLVEQSQAGCWCQRLSAFVAHAHVGGRVKGNFSKNRDVLLATYTEGNKGNPGRRSCSGFLELQILPLHHPGSVRQVGLESDASGMLFLSLALMGQLEKVPYTADYDQWSHFEPKMILTAATWVERRNISHVQATKCFVFDNLLEGRKTRVQLQTRLSWRVSFVLPGKKIISYLYTKNAIIPPIIITKHNPTRVPMIVRSEKEKTDILFELRCHSTLAWTSRSLRRRFLVALDLILIGFRNKFDIYNRCTLYFTKMRFQLFCVFIKDGEISSQKLFSISHTTNLFLNLIACALLQIVFVSKMFWPWFCHG